jgi:hypothetical protein
LAISARKTHTLFRKRIDMRRFKVRMARTAEIVPTKLIEHNEQNVLGFVCHGPLQSSWDICCNLSGANDKSMYENGDGDKFWKYIK